MSSVSFDNVQKAYGDVPVIRGLSLEIEPGEFVVLVGPSGCGKSTLLRMVAGLEAISDGEIRIGPRRVNELAPRERDIAMVFQSYALYPHMNVAENMSFALRLQKRPAAEIEQRVSDAARMLGLDRLLDRFPRQLSGGQRQRVAMGRAIVRKPQVFLFDEPLSNLDAKLRVQMRADIKELHYQLDTTAIYVTHDQIEAMTMADKIVVMHDGVIEQFGTPLDLYDDPANQFVAGFIGSPAMNFLAVEAVPGGLALSDGQWIPGHFDLAPGRKLWVGVRPERFGIVPPLSSPTGAHGARADRGIAAKVRVVEPTGPDTYVVAELAGSEVTIVLHQRLAVRPGEMLYLHVQPESLFLFDHADGRRVREAGHA